jgi:hypothetical protein
LALEGAYFLIENITKLDAAKRQLREAIWLFFYERDAISIHTLVAASHHILDDLCKHKGINQSIRRNSIIRKDKQKYWRNRISHAENYFKHADKDPEVVCEFNPSLTQSFISDSIHLYYEITKSIFPEAMVYCLWFMIKS